MKIAVITCDASGYAHAGMDVERRVRVFEMPQDMADYITKISPNAYGTVALAMVEEEGAK